MKRIISLLFVSALVVVPALPQETEAAAPKRKGRIQSRKQNQQERIGAGVESGALTPAEAAKLESKEARLNREIRKDRKDGGGLTQKERVKIERKQDRLSRQVAKEKHDRQRAKP